MKTFTHSVEARTIYILCLIFLIGAPRLTAQNDLKYVGRIVQHELRTAKGNVIVNMPAEIAAGDIISGITEIIPSGNNAKKTQRNSEHLAAYQLLLGNNICPVSEKKYRLNVPKDFFAAFIDSFWFYFAILNSLYYCFYRSRNIRRN